MHHQETTRDRPDSRCGTNRGQCGANGLGRGADTATHAAVRVTQCHHQRGKEKRLARDSIRIFFSNQFGSTALVIVSGVVTQTR